MPVALVLCVCKFVSVCVWNLVLTIGDKSFKQDFHT